MDEPVHADGPGGAQQVQRGRDIGVMKLPVRSPDAGFRGDMKNGAAAGDDAPGDFRIGEIAAHKLHAQLFQLRLRAPARDAHGAAFRQQTLHDRPAEEAAAAGDEGGPRRHAHDRRQRANGAGER